MSMGIRLILISRGANSAPTMKTIEIEPMSRSTRDSLYEALNSDALRNLETTNSGLALDQKLFVTADIFVDRKADEFTINGRWTGKPIATAIFEAQEHIGADLLNGLEVEAFAALY